MVIFVGVALLVARDPTPEPTTTTAVPTTTAAPATVQPAAVTVPPSPSVAALLAQLVVAPEGRRDGYDRSLFGGWIDADRNGCNTRCEVLAAQRLPSLPGLAGGGWVSTYDGYSTDNPRELEIDHVVALAEAWDSGASTWGPERRRAFANDLNGELRAVTAATNRAKSDKDPAEWQPSNRDAWCAYATDWVRVKVAWGLSADVAEVSAVTNMVRGCP